MATRNCTILSKVVGFETAALTRLDWETFGLATVSHDTAGSTRRCCAGGDTTIRVVRKPARVSGWLRQTHSIIVGHNLTVIGLRAQLTGKYVSEVHRYAAGWS